MGAGRRHQFTLMIALGYRSQAFQRSFAAGDPFEIEAVRTRRFCRLASGGPYG